MREEIKDTEIRVIGGRLNRTKNRWKWALIGILGVVLIPILCILLSHQDTPASIVENVYHEIVTPTTTPIQSWFAELDTITVVGTATKDTLINDVPLRLFVPLNATPHLEVGYDALKDTTRYALLFRAADVRADNKKIVGAFVLRGKPLSWGLSKKGYCAIIDNQITVGVADNSPLFEEATDKNGYFFRQYALVDNGQLMENELKEAFVRRGLCEIAGRIIVVETQTKITMHEFSQVLIDFGVTNAIYLVGNASTIGWYRDLDGQGVPLGVWKNIGYNNVSFIVWSE